jgi:hypothetical protein
VVRRPLPARVLVTELALVLGVTALGVAIARRAPEARVLAALLVLVGRYSCSSGHLALESALSRARCAVGQERSRG